MQARLGAWRSLLQTYPDPSYTYQLLGMIQFGCLLGYDRPLCNRNRHTANLPIDAVGHAHLHRELATRLAEGCLSVVCPKQPLVESPIGVVPKPRSSKLHTIHHLSFPRCPSPNTLPSINKGIDPAFVAIKYESTQSLVHYVRLNRGCLLWKSDLEDAFRHVVTSEVDAPLLGFTYDGVWYRENALTFGGSSSPFLFNLVAEALHWVVESSLLADWPLNHYLDNTFGAIPTEAHDLSFLPVHVLALAAAALGLRLSARKTFVGLTRLEILSVEIDSVAQTVSITKDWKEHLLSRCHQLLRRSTADLFDMQQISGLLHFIFQVFPCGRAFLHCLYDCTRRSPWLLSC